MLRVYLLGEPNFQFNGAAYHFHARPRVLPLLAFLLLHRRRPLHRDQLAAAFWPDAAESTARANLRRHLHHLQQALPAAPGKTSWIEVDQRVQWRSDAPCWLDIAEFEALLGRGDDLSSAEAAIELYRGDLLLGITEEWVAGERERFRGQFVASARTVIAGRRDSGDLEGAFHLVRRLLADDPLDEESVRLGMLLRAQLGDRTGALRLYRQFVERARADLDASPLQATIELFRSIQQASPADRAFAPARPTVAADCAGRTRLREPDQPPLVGRDTELAQLRALWQRTRDGRGATILVSGEAGIGKTRLALELVAEARRAGDYTLIGSTTEQEPLPYQAITTALRSATPSITTWGLAANWRRSLVGLLPELQDKRVKLMPGVATDADRERRYLHEAIGHLLETIAASQPTLMVIEDLHWAGSSTIELVEYLARRCLNAPVMLLATYREDEAARTHPLRAMRRRLAIEGYSQLLALDRLSRAAARSLVERYSQPGVDVENLTTSLYAATDGNPLFLVELLRDFADRGHSSFADAALPTTIQAAVLARLSRLSPRGRKLAETAAIIGVSFDLEVVGEVLAWSRRETETTLAELLDRRLARESFESSSGEYRFAHHITQAAIYSTIARGARRRGHSRIAAVIEELAADRLDDLAAQLAFHYAVAGDRERALAYYARAARRALVVHNDDDARTAINRGLELEPTPTQEVELLLLLETIQGRANDRSSQRRTLSRLQTLTNRSGDDAAYFESLTRQLRFYELTSDNVALGETIAAFRARAEALGSTKWLAAARFHEGYHRARHYDHAASRNLIEAALALYTQLGDAGQMADCHAVLSQNARGQSRHEACRAHADESVHLAEQSGDTARQMRALHFAARAADVYQDHDATKRYIDRLMQMCLEVGDQTYELIARTYRGGILGREGYAWLAREELEIIRAIAQPTDRGRWLANATATLARIHEYVGRYDEAAQLADAAINLASEINEIDQTVYAMVQAATAQARLGLDDAARATAERGLSLAHELGNQPEVINFNALLSRIARHQGRTAESQTRAAAAVSVAREFGVAARLALAIEAQALAAEAAADWPTVQRSVAELVNLLTGLRSEFPYRPHAPAWTIARLAGRSGDQQLARTWLNTAYQLYQQRLDRIGTPTWIASFANIAEHRQLVAAYREGNHFGAPIG